MNPPTANLAAVAGALGGCPVVSFAIATRNRREVVLQTLGQVLACGLSAGEFEVLVVDNASGDGTAEAVGREHPWARVIASGRNHGSCGKSLAVAEARGSYVVFLDDDSYPQPGAIEAMIEAFEADERLGAVTFGVDLADGRQECSAYPDVFVGCGVGLRVAALREVGGLPRDFYTQAEEYDLALRLLDGGWAIRRVAGARVRHLKTQACRAPWRTMKMDVRNNLLVLGRRAPAEAVLPLAADWLRRYWLIARAERRRSAFLLGAAQGMAAMVLRPSRNAVMLGTFERFTRAEQIRCTVTRWAAENGLRSVLLADLGKNVLAYWRAARAAGLSPVAVADDRLAGGRYRGVQIVSEARASKMHFDGVLVANSSPVHAAATAERWSALTPRPVLDALWVGAIRGVEAAA